MNIFINAVSIHEGGAFVVLTKLLESMSQAASGIHWYVAAKSDILKKLPQSKSIICIDCHQANVTPLHLFYWYEITLPMLLRKVKADVCFSQTNYLPKRKLACPSLLLVQHAGHFSDLFEQLHLQWNKRFLNAYAWQKKKNWVYRSIQQATAVTVQTKALADNIQKKLVIDEKKIHVIPHGPGLMSSAVEPSSTFSKLPWRIGYITKFGVQKDFETAFKAILLLKQKNSNIKFILTLDESTLEFKAIFKKIQDYGLENLIENHGEIKSVAQVEKLYQSLHLFIFPSLCESFGFTLTEAITLGLPVLIADTESNREVAGGAGNIFQSRNADELANQIDRLMNDSHYYLQSSKKSLERAPFFSWDKTANQILQLLYSLKT